MQILTRLFLLIIFLLKTSFVLALDLKLNPSLEVNSFYSDNIDKKEQSTNSAFGTRVIPSFTLLQQGAKLNSFGIYEIHSNSYSDTSDFNNTYQQALLNSNYKINENIKFFNKLKVEETTKNPKLSLANTNRRNIKLDDVFSNTIGTQFSTKTNDYIKSDLVLSANYIETDISNYGNSTGQNARLISTQGRNFSSVYWDINSEYFNEQNDVNGDYYYFENETIFGKKLYKSFGIFLRSFSQNYNYQQFQDRDFSTFGSGLSYSDNKFYLNLGYNKVIKSRNNTNNHLYLETKYTPKEETNFYINLAEEFYGRSYEFLAKHKIEHSSYQISYTEKIESFATSFSNSNCIDLNCDSFDDFNDLTSPDNFIVTNRVYLDKLLEFLTQFERKTNRLSFKTFYQHKETKSNNQAKQETKDIGAQILFAKKLNDLLKFTTSFENKINRLNKKSDQQKVSASFIRELNRQSSFEIGASKQIGDYQQLLDTYSENRVFLNLIFNFN